MTDRERLIAAGVIKVCSCGHTHGDHKSSGSTSLYAVRRYGVCLREGCSCREFVERAVDEPKAAA